MSLGSHFVRAVDGNWYEQPMFQKPETWFLCFDEDDPPELVIRVPKTGPTNEDHQPSDRAHAANIANAVLFILFRKAITIRFRASYAGRMFATVQDPTKHVMFPAVSFFVPIKDRIPVPKIHAGPVLHGDKPWLEAGSRQATYIDPARATW